ncbi:hypothetical protein DSN97_04610 [Deferribacteraceae bacterium V6Fe1]|nr:hypothetical protein DSN97_04610 [Deferribacteraceae bacterium V6Fe1]
MKYFLIFILITGVVFAGDFLVTDTLPDNYRYLTSLKRFELKETSKPMVDSEKRENISMAISLTGVFEMNNRYFAIIDDEIYTEGDVIKGYKIIKIELNRVTFLNNGKKVVKDVRDN